MSAALDAIRGLAPAIRAAIPAMQQARACPDDLAGAMAEAGVFRLCVPRALGGLEASPRLLVEALEALGEADASAAWVGMIGATTGVLSAYLPDDAAAEIFGGGRTIVTGVYAPSGQAMREGEGWRVNGRWSWNSGGRNSAWLAAGCALHDATGPRKSADGGPEHRLILVPRADVQHHDTWWTGGLRGTGSGDMAIEGAFAPASRAVSLVADQPRATGALYAFPVFGLLAIGIAAVASGNAKGAMAEFAAFSAAKRTPGGRSLAQRGATQALFAAAEAERRAARAFLFDEIDAAAEEAARDGEITPARRAGVRLAATHMTRTAARVVRDVQDAAGGAGVFLAEPLQRRLADAQTATAHVMVAAATLELTGRVLLGGAASIQEL